MVKSFCQIILLFIAVQLPLALSAKNVADYQVGDKAEEDIVAPSRLSVVDQDETDAMKQKEAMHVPAVLRYNTNAADEVEAQFRDIFSKTQVNFLKAVDDAFGHPTLSADELSSTNFAALVVSFQQANQLFPLSATRAALWASGDPDTAYEASLADTLRQAMSPIMRPEPLPAGIKLGYTVRLVPMGNFDARLTVGTAEHLGKGYPRSNLVAFAQVKKDFQKVFDVEESDVAKYLVTLLKPNCVVEAEITQQLRARRTDGISSVVNYEPGETIVHRGQVIDKKIKAALDQLKDKVVVGQLQDLQAKQQAAVGQLQALVADNTAKTTQNQAHLHWLIGALAAVVVLLALAIWQLAQRRQAISLLPVPMPGEAAEQWQQRALMAEQRMEKMQNAARAGLMAHLSQWLSQAFTRRLIVERKLLLEAQKMAATEMAEMEARLEKIQAPLQDRLTAYERRIAELEKELATRDEENRALLKAQIEFMRKQLESQREKGRGPENRLMMN